MERSVLEKFDLPDCPGVYLFTQGKGKSKKVLYVGKATSLRDRVRSYFDIELIATRGPRIVDMVTMADAVEHETTPTVLEALVREAALIREYEPRANAMGKDDKTFLYAVITKEPIPRVLAVRGGELDFAGKKWGTISLTAIHGPFPSGYQLRQGLRLIRRIFPFFDTPRPVGEGNKHVRGKVEFNRQIGLYPRDMDSSSYMRSIRNVSLFLSGRVKALRTTLTKDMNEYARKEQFEEAAKVRKQLFALDHIQDVSLIREDREGQVAGPRIEAFDTAHISGTNAIGVMIVVEEGIPDKKQYRTFRIRGSKGMNDLRSRSSIGAHSDNTNERLTKSFIDSRRNNDDIASLKEILNRRLGHSEWPLPRAFVVDGGKTHKKAAEEVLKEVGIEIPVVAVVKDDKHRPREVIGSLRAGITDADAVLANSEAHRFSLANHRKARSRALRTGS